MKKNTLGIVGHGRFGSLVEKFLKQNFNIIIFDKNADFRNISLCKVIIICVPISDFEDAIVEIKDFIKPGSLVIDVCSVKMHPIQIMEKFLPVNIHIIATHPMFGPDSTTKGLKNLKIVICKSRCSKDIFGRFKSELIKLGLVTIVMTPKEHDELIARSQLFTHLIGRIGEKLKILPTGVDTENFKKLLEIQRVVINDSFQLFIDMNRFNPFAEDLRIEFKKELDNLERQI